MSKNHFLARYGDSDHIHHAINDESGNDYYAAHKLATENPEFNEHHLTKLLDCDSMSVRKLAAMHPKITDAHVAKIMRDDSYNSGAIKRAVMLNDNVKSHALKKAFDNGSKETRDIIGKSTFLPQELHQHVLNNSHDEEINRVVNSRIDSDKKLDDFYDSVKDHPLLN